MRNDTTYNGWTNKQTWNINLMYEEIFASMAEDQEFDDVEHMADAFEQLVEELEFADLKQGSLAYQAVGDYLNAVNWVEIAKTHFKNEISEEDYETIQDVVDSLELNH